jgi:COP9 signalosome complex subunit 2
LAKIWLEKKQFNKLAELIRTLHAAVNNEKNSSAERKASTLLEIHAVEIQMYTETKNNQMLKVEPNSMA